MPFLLEGEQWDRRRSKGDRKELKGGHRLQHEPVDRGGGPGFWHFLKKKVTEKGGTGPGKKKKQKESFPEGTV